MAQHDTIQIATALIQKHTKKQLVIMARSLGWRGDDAREPILKLALYVAQKQAQGERQEGGGSESRRGDADAKNGGEGGGAGDAGGEQSQQGEGAQSQGGEGGGEQSEGEGEGEQSEGGDGQQGGGEQSEGEGEQSEGEGEQSEGGDKKKKGEGEQSEGEGDEQSQQGGGADADAQQDKPKLRKPEQRHPPSNKDWAAMLKKRGITHPHPMLRKVYVMTVCARQNVMLVGPAGCGKSMLGEQLALLIYGNTDKFQATSCTSGVSESQLIGTMLPAKNFEFEYCPAPFVTVYEHGGVFLLDEMDRADANTLIILNQALANGMLYIPLRRGNTQAKKSNDAIVLSSCNTLGGGADEMYSTANMLDAATVDRFYIVRCDYDEAYEAGAFGIKRKGAAAWMPTTEQPDYINAGKIFFALRLAVDALKVKRLLGTRFSHGLIDALQAGVSIADAVNDLTSHWSIDEKRRVFTMAVQKDSSIVGLPRV